MTARQPRNSTTIAGFTLLEALVATALMGMILAALATITAQWLPNWNRGIVRVQRDDLVALGLDRLIALLAGESSIREVMAFPKTANAVDLMAGAPSPVEARQLTELHLKTQP